MYGYGYLGISMSIVPSSLLSAVIRLSEGDASSMSLPSIKGVVIFPACLHPTHNSGLIVAKVSHRCGPLMSHAFLSVSAGLYSSCAHDILCIAVSLSTQN